MPKHISDIIKDLQAIKRKHGNLIVLKAEAPPVTNHHSVPLAPDSDATISITQTPLTEDFVLGEVVGQPHQIFLLR